MPSISVCIYPLFFPSFLGKRGTLYMYNTDKFVSVVMYKSSVCTYVRYDTIHYLYIVRVDIIKLSQFFFLGVHIILF